MLFCLLKYLQPTHYFQLYRKTEASVFPVVEALPAEILGKLKEDKDYQTDLAIAYDLSWQAIQSGYIGDAPTYQDFTKLPLRDNYRFLRKNFHHAWVFYVLMMRLITLHNPFKEVSAWFQTRNVSRVPISSKKFYDKAYEAFQSELLLEAPKISVVIPTLNRYDYLKAILNNLEQQDYTNFDVIVVDQSEPFDASFYDDFQLDIQLIRQEEKALWLARNTAIQNAQSEWIALSEDDVLIAPNWLSSHLKCIDFFKAQVSAGVFYPEGAQIPLERSFFARSTQFATGNAMLHKSVFKKTGLFDRQFEKQRMGDGEFGMRVYLNNIKSISNPLASCVDVKAGSGGLREMGSWDAFRPSNFFSPRPVPSVLYFYRRYFGNKSAKLALLRTVPLSVFPYQFKKNKPLQLLGVLVTVLILPLVLYQVLRSWHIASAKIQEGPLIKSLE
ncbi:glycosyltransferase family 2 protein [Psychroserpens sp. BH13MA-6]